MRRLFSMAGLQWAMPWQVRPQVAPALVEFAADRLRRMIEATRQDAIAAGVRPVPAGVYRAMLGYFPPALLRKVRYGSGRVKRLSLPALAFSYGDAKAMTLGDVVLFKDERLAQGDLKLWAHELAHVMQCQRWGIDGFAQRYVRDSRDVEREAKETAKRFLAWQDQA
jgi:hypothetical protein